MVLLGLDDVQQDQSARLARMIPLLVLLFAYLVAFDGGSRGATPGKRIVGIRVADEATGGPIGYSRATVRRLIYLIGGWLLFIGWLWGLGNARRQTWHDKAAKSVVVRAASPRRSRSSNLAEASS
jgi:uncharacterized RDD family membrane protein YckC